MKTQYSIDSAAYDVAAIDMLCKTVLHYEIRVQFLEKKFAELSQQFKTHSKLTSPQHLCQADADTLHILGLNIQQIQALPSLGLSIFILFNLFSCLIVVTHLLLFQIATQWRDLFPAYLECCLFFLLCVAAGVIFRATRVTHKLDEILCSIGALFGLVLAWGSAKRLFFYAEDLSTFSLNHTSITTQIFQLYTQLPTGMWSQFLFIILCLLGGLVFYASSYLFAASPDVAKIIRRYPDLFQIQHTDQLQQNQYDLDQDINKANSNLRTLARLQNKLISECAGHPIFVPLQLCTVTEHHADVFLQLQEQVTCLAADLQDIELQQKLEQVQTVFNRVHYLCQAASALQQRLEQFNPVATEKI